MQRAFAAGFGIALFIAPTFAHANDEETVRVEVNGSRDAVLERIIEGTDLWESICVGPCGSTLPSAGEYRVSGHGVRPSLPMWLVPAGHNKTVQLDTSLAYRTGWIGGVLFTVLGPVTSIAGALAIALQTQPFVTQPPCTTLGCPPATSQPQSNTIPIAGGLTIGVGVVMTLAGIIALIVSDHSTVRQRGLTLSGRSLTVTF